MCELISPGSFTDCFGLVNAECHRVLLHMDFDYNAMKTWGKKADMWAIKCVSAGLW